jgi:hypothetical protein
MRNFSCVEKDGDAEKKKEEKEREREKKSKRSNAHNLHVTPAKAGVHQNPHWIPAFAGMTA